MISGVATRPRAPAPVPSAPARAAVPAPPPSAAPSTASRRHTPSAPRATVSSPAETRVSTPPLHDHDAPRLHHARRHAARERLLELLALAVAVEERGHRARTASPPRARPRRDPRTCAAQAVVADLAPSRTRRWAKYGALGSGKPSGRCRSSTARTSPISWKTVGRSFGGGLERLVAQLPQPAGEIALHARRGPRAQRRADGREERLLLRDDRARVEVGSRRFGWPLSARGVVFVESGDHWLQRGVPRMPPHVRPATARALTLRARPPHRQVGRDAPARPLAREPQARSLQRAGRRAAGLARKGRGPGRMPAPSGNRHDGRGVGRPWSAARISSFRRWRGARAVVELRLARRRRAGRRAGPAHQVPARLAHGPLQLPLHLLLPAAHEPPDALLSRASSRGSSGSSPASACGASGSPAASRRSARTSSRSSRDAAATPGIEDVAITTNGHRLAELVEPLRDAGLGALNVSLDTLAPSGSAASPARRRGSSGSSRASTPPPAGSARSRSTPS